MSDLLNKIAKLLKKAEATDNAHEAEAFMQAAQRLATSTQIDLEVARAHSAKGEQRKVPTQETYKLFERRARKLGKTTYVSLFLGIAAANDVKCDIAQDSSHIYMYGFDTDIELVVALYESLSAQMLIASDHHLKHGEREMVWKEATEKYNYRTREWEFKDSQMVPESGRTVRVSFQEAFAHQVTRRLREARKLAVQAVEDQRAQEAAALMQDVDVSSGAELVLANKAVEVADFYKSKSNARGSYRGFRNSGNSYSHTANNAGAEAGRRARLGGEKAIGGHRTQVSA